MSRLACAVGSQWAEVDAVPSERTAAPLNRPPSERRVARAAIGRAAGNSAKRGETAGAAAVWPCAVLPTALAASLLPHLVHLAPTALLCSEGISIPTHPLRLHFDSVVVRSLPPLVPVQHRHCGPKEQAQRQTPPRAFQHTSTPTPPTRLSSSRRIARVDFTLPHPSAFLRYST